MLIALFGKRKLKLGIEFKLSNILFETRPDYEKY